MNASIIDDNALTQQMHDAEPMEPTRRSAYKRQRKTSTNRFSANMASLTNEDITTIVALREFLIFGAGGRILETLLMINTTVSRLVRYQIPHKLTLESPTEYALRP